VRLVDEGFLRDGEGSVRVSKKLFNSEALNICVEVRVCGFTPTRYGGALPGAGDHLIFMCLPCKRARLAKGYGPPTLRQ
jgi:hypothetical protein